MVDDCVTGHSVVIYDRGGQRRLWELRRLTSVEWSRKRDSFSTAKVVLSGQSCAEQADVLGQIMPRRHEMVIYRGAERVWEGPLLRVSTLNDEATLEAVDVGGYIAGTVCSVHWAPNAGEPVGDDIALMTERIRAILEWELTEPYQATVGTGSATQTITVPRWENIAQPANVLPFLDIRRSETLYTWADVQPFQMTVAEHLQSLARGGLDYTTVGRSVVIWDSRAELGRTRILTDADFGGEMRVILDGTAHYGISHVVASTDDEESDAPAVGSAGGEDDYYGVWTNLVTLDQEEGADTPSQDALNSQAQRDQIGRTPVPLAIVVPDSATLHLSDTLGLGDLVPGVTVPVRAELNIRRFQQDQRLDSLVVIENATGEAIKVSMSGVGDVQAVEG